MEPCKSTVKIPSLLSPELRYKLRRRLENTQMVMKEMWFFFGMLMEALKIPYRNPNFIVLAFLSSLPLFTFMLINDIFVQQALIQTGSILTEAVHPKGFFDFDQTRLGLIGKAIEKASNKLILGFMFLVVLHILDFLNTVAIVDSASIVYKGETPMNLMDMLRRPLKETRYKGPLITSIYTFTLAALVFLGLISQATYIYIFSAGLSLFMMVFVLIFIALLVKSVEWSVMWNMSIVISVSEEKHGDVALVLSSYYSRGGKGFGPVFMLVFLVWSLFLRASCLYMRWREGGNGIGVTSAYVGLVCLGNTVKWLVFVVYLHYCKSQRLERVDLKVERGGEAVQPRI